jgi:uncharacterized protein YjbI with pentapeptide repeats
VWTIVAAIVLAATSAHASPIPAIKCVQAKNRAAVTKLFCLAREESKLLLGKPANFARCSAAFTRAFANAEALGACPTNGDTASVEQRVDDAQGAVLSALQAPLAATGPAKRCVATKDQAAGRFASCTSKLLGQRLGGQAATTPCVGCVGEQIARCHSVLGDSFAAAEARGGCPTVGDSAAVGALANPAGMNLSHVAFDAASQSLAQLDLTGADLRNADLNHVDATDAKLIDADLTNANLDFLNAAGYGGPNLDLSGANLTNASLVGADIRIANLTGANFSTATLVSVRAIGLGGCPASLPPDWSCTNRNLVGPSAIASFASLPGADFSGRNLTGITFDQADLSDANLANATLTGAGFVFANITGADLTGTDLTTAALTRVKATGVAGCPAALPADWSCTLNNLVGPDVFLEGANLSGADLSGRNLGGLLSYNTNFGGANLASADFTSSADYSADFTNADLTGANLNLAYIFNPTWSNTTCPDGTNSATNGSSPESCCAHLGVSNASCFTP